MGDSETLTILVVDDDPTGRLLTVELLRKRFPQAEMLEEESAVAALVHVQTRRLELIVSDNSMMELSGLSFIRKIRQVDPRVPIILHTASHELKQEAMRAGATAFVPSNEAHRLAEVAEAVLRATDTASR
jgi:CheY-like chemotaxis protein